MESIHKTLNRVRKPRVHISYDVETEGAVHKKELPFVVGVMGDFSGDPTSDLKPLRDRRFVQIDKDNFDDVLKSMTPGLKLSVNNTLSEEESTMAVDLKFESMADFEPEAIVNQVEPLKKLMEARNKLRDLSTKADRSDDLEDIIEKVLNNEADLNDLAAALGTEKVGE
ncbi:type VI secretion system contractile sheath small subunit [Halioxenophilus aromaticivorans]|uniref:Type VI secretion system contractile sheath small subunit n=1 Tax=Halioxenophilus aromaticivorans TaxID=1306992 RepID=A0AAV3U2Q0_9ALTE